MKRYPTHTQTTRSAILPPVSYDAILTRLRAICLALPEAVEGQSFGHPAFRIADKNFVVLEEYRGELCIVLKVGKPTMGLFAEDPRFFPAPYIGKHGWISMRAAGKLNWTEIKGLVAGSYRLVAPKRLTT